jgi:hypothetical protein
MSDTNNKKQSDNASVEKDCRNLQNWEIGKEKNGPPPKPIKVPKK